MQSLGVEVMMEEVVAVAKEMSEEAGELTESVEEEGFERFLYHPFPAFSQVAQRQISLPGPKYSSRLWTEERRTNDARRSVASQRTKERIDFSCNPSRIDEVEDSLEKSDLSSFRNIPMNLHRNRIVVRPDEASVRITLRSETIRRDEVSSALSLSSSHHLSTPKL